MMRTLIESMKLSTGKVFGVVCAVLLAMTVCFSVQLATAEDAYANEDGYTVTLYAGNGKINGKDWVEVGTYAYNAQNPAIATIDLSKYAITPPESKYYIKGIREAGHDELANASFPVTEDKQFVVAYGLKGDQTHYTVNFVDGAGNQLAESVTLEANVGDKPVVSSQYIEGYKPDAWNKTKTLGKNEAANVFTFVYAPVADTSGIAGGEEAGAEGASGDVAEGQDQAAGVADEPAELIDIDDEGNPLAGISTENAEGFSVANVLPWVLGVLVVIALISVIALMVAKKRAGKDAS